MLTEIQRNLSQAGKCFLLQMIALFSVGKQQEAEPWPNVNPASTGKCRGNDLYPKTVQETFELLSMFLPMWKPNKKQTQNRNEYGLRASS